MTKHASANKGIRIISLIEPIKTTHEYFHHFNPNIVHGVVAPVAVW